jgi:hypothetical protein
MAAVGALGASLVGSALAMAPSAQAYDTGTTKVSCSAVKVRKSPSQSGTVVGVAYKGDKVTYNQWVYKKSEKRWWTRASVRRKSDAVVLKGYLIYQCANPYGTNGAPTPPIPK